MRKSVILTGWLGMAALGAGYLLSYTRKGTFREFQGIFTVVEPQDLELYSSLIRDPMKLPSKPAVAL